MRLLRLLRLARGCRAARSNRALLLRLLLRLRLRLLPLPPLRRRLRQLQAWVGLLLGNRCRERRRRPRLCSCAVRALRLRRPSRAATGADSGTRSPSSQRAGRAVKPLLADCFHACKVAQSHVPQINACLQSNGSAGDCT